MKEDHHFYTTGQQAEEIMRKEKELRDAIQAVEAAKGAHDALAGYLCTEDEKKEKAKQI